MRYLIALLSVLMSASLCLATDPADIHCDRSNTFCAASCSLAHVQAAVDSAMAGAEPDVIVYIPACLPSPYAWASGSMLAVDTKSNAKKLRLLGSGQHSTQIEYFKLQIPTDRRTNLVEFGHLTVDGKDAVSFTNVTNNLIAPEQNFNELYWHDFTLSNYTGNYTLSFLAWHGVVSGVTFNCEYNATTSQSPYGITVYGDGDYSDHTPDLGSRRAFFIEDSTFTGCSHSLSQFCDGFTVFRYNTVRNQDSHLDSHGPGYNYCPINPGAGQTEHAGAGFEAYNNVIEAPGAPGSYGFSPRTGMGGLIFNNRCDGVNYCVRLKSDTTSCNGVNGLNCGDGIGETTGRCYTIGCTGCCQAPENWFVWNNQCTGAGCAAALFGTEESCDDGVLAENKDYFLRAPTAADLGFDYTPFTYPHPLRTAATTKPPADPGNLTVQ